MSDFMYLLPYLAVMSIGSMVGLSELFIRYSYSVREIALTFSAYVYVLLNAGAAALALFMMKYFDFSFGLKLDSEGARVLVAGLAGMVILRSSVLTIKANDESYNVGFGVLVNVFLQRADKSFDQERASRHGPEVAIVMKNIDFRKARIDLPAVCLALMQNLPLESQRALKSEIDLKDSEKGGLSMEVAKSMILGITIAKYTGVEVLKQSIQVLGKEIEYSDEAKIAELEREADQVIEKLEKRQQDV